MEIYKRNTRLEEEKRRSFILETIETLKKLTPELKIKILNAKTIQVLEDLYAPYKSKRKTKGQIALELGLGHLADLVLTTKNNINELGTEIKKYLSEDLKTEEDVLKGVQAIISESVSNNTDIKEVLRRSYWEDAELESSTKGL